MTPSKARLDAVDFAALEEFAARYGDVQLPPVTVVIAAYNEAANIASVLQSIPREICGLGVATVVVDDGSSDGTADIARGQDVYVCAPARNRGQGAALRLGYHLAKLHGARFIATTDADGQYDATELDLIVQPLVDGTADFVTGSRRLGLYSTNDVVRHAGVHVFASIMSVIARRRVTDTSNGFRAFRADIVDHLILEQPQYQATELLIGVFYRGFRVVEIGTTMRQRTSGSSKKGPNLVYGYRFGRVILRTWLREWRRNRSEGRRLSDPPPVAPAIDLTATDQRHTA
ncbi:MAG: glycosyltransferase family 2 protein [Frankiales bacterium]|nr:glycosyltransferase family 2 protein [Frankiales bacterium]